MAGRIGRRSASETYPSPPPPADDHKTVVDSSDVVPGFLDNKLSAGANIIFTIINVGGDEKIVVSAVVPPGASDHKVLVDGADTTAAFLGAKLVGGVDVSLTVLNPGGNEQIQINVAGAPPTGAAGGDLGGTYPNPTVVALEETSGPTHLTIGAIPAGTILIRSGTSVIGIATTAVGDHKLLVNGLDTTADFLSSKLAAGSNVSLTVLNPGGNEQVQISVSSTPPSGAAGGDLGSTYPNPTVIALEETGGPTRLTFGAIAAGSILQRVGSSVVGTAGTLGAVLIHDGTQFQPITFGSFNINTNANQAPTVAQGSTFFVDATALTANRNIIPDTTGAAERQGITFIVTVPTSGGGFSFSLVADITLVLNQKMMVECVFKSGAWQIGEWKPYQGTL